MKITIDMDFLNDEGNPSEALRNEIVNIAVGKIVSDLTSELRTSMKADIKEQVAAKITAIVSGGFADMQMTYAQGRYTDGHNQPISVQEYLEKTIENGIRYYDQSGFCRAIDDRVQGMLAKLDRQVTEAYRSKIAATEKKINESFDSALLNLIKKAQKDG